MVKWLSAVVGRQTHCALDYLASGCLRRNGRSSLKVSSTAWGITRTLPTTDMKLISPFQRGHQMGVDMARHSGPGTAANVDADIKALRVHGLLQHFLSLNDQSIISPRSSRG